VAGNKPLLQRGDKGIVRCRWIARRRLREKCDKPPQIGIGLFEMLAG
jgi:hypothetical protein